MIVFQKEIEDGLDRDIISKASISYASVAEPCSDNIKSGIDFKAFASMSDEDLYYTQSILVSTSWNKNDDIFDKNEVWTARHSPEHKPTNIEHNENTIVGHIVSNFPITEDGILIDENTPTENLPEKYHILTGSVIYKSYTDPELQERTKKLISEIQSGSKYVSMECFFKGFDYGLLDKSTNKYKILSRNEETSFLTKHLRAYGGLGEHENYKIGRVLRNITFTGKGFVDKPANPESIIFTKNTIQIPVSLEAKKIFEEKNQNFENIGVFSNQANLKENQMNLETDILELKNKIEAMNSCSEHLAQANSTILSLKEEISNLKTETEAKDKMTQEYLNKMKVSEEDKKKMKADFDEELAKTKADTDNISADYVTKIEDLNKEIESLKSELLATNETVAAYKSKEEEMMKKEKKMKRMSSLIENGLDQQLAASTADKFENLDDATFEEMTSIIQAVKSKNVTESSNTQQTETEAAVEEKAIKTEASEISEDVLENVETENDIVLSVGSEPEVDSTHAALVDFVRARLGKKLNKGE
jgi:hypothetical protein